MKTIINILLLCISLSFSAHAHEVISSWESKRKTEHVELQYRWLNVGDTLKTRELKAIFSIEASHATIIHSIKNAEKVSQWTAGVKYFKTYVETQNSWVSYCEYDIPKPFPSQDLITQYTVKTYADKTHLTIKALPQFLPEKNDINRLKHYEGQWILYATKNGITKVEFYSTSFAKPFFPRFIQDPIIQRILTNSFSDLKKLCEHEVIAQN